MALGLDYTVLCLKEMADLFFSLAARSWKEYSERIFSGCPYGDTTTRVSHPWLLAGNVVPSAARGMRSQTVYVWLTYFQFSDCHQTWLRNLANTARDTPCHG